MRTPSREAGFSIVELMVVLLILGITLAASLPAFNRYLASSTLQNASEEFAGRLKLARQTAVAQGVPQIVSWNTASQTYSIITDSNGDGVAQAGEPVLGPFDLPNGITLANDTVDPFAGTQLTFNPNGSASQSGTVVLSNTKNGSLNLSVLAPTGQVRVH
jgi:type II secretion system protein H